MFQMAFNPLMFVRGDAESNHAESALGNHSHYFGAWSGPPRHTKAEKVMSCSPCLRQGSGAWLGLCL